MQFALQKYILLLNLPNIWDILYVFVTNERPNGNFFVFFYVNIGKLSYLCTRNAKMCCPRRCT